MKYHLHESRLTVYSKLVNLWFGHGSGAWHINNAERPTPADS